MTPGTIVFYNGDFYDSASPLLNIEDRAGRYGDGIFETIRYADGKIMFFDQHYARMINGVNALRMEWPSEYSFENFHAIILKLIAKNAFQNARIRIIVSRNSKGFYTPLTNECNISIACNQPYEPLSSYQLNKEGLICGMFQGEQKSTGILSNLKTLNGLLYVMAGINATEQGWNDSFILNTKGRVIESSNSNIFIRINEKYLTPPLSDGCIDGVMRNRLIHLLRTKGFPLFETSINEADILNADEILLTNVISGIRWVKQFQNREYRCGQAEHLVDLINL